MALERTVRLSRWANRHSRAFNVVGWTCFAVVSADYARFINLPTIVTLPFWAGVVLNVLRWGVWEGMVKPRIEAAGEGQERVTSGSE
jgi:hypothetical protein